MRIIFLATLPPQSASIVGRTIPLAEELIKRDHKVKIFSLGESTLDNDLVKIVGPAFRKSNTKPGPIATGIRLKRGARALEQITKKEKADVFVLSKAHPQNTFAARKVTVPVILDADDDERHSSRLSFLEKKFMGIVENRASAKASLVTACSPYLIERYENELGAKKTSLIPTGISSHMGRKKIDFHKKIGIIEDAPIVLYIGSVAISSGHRVDHVLQIWDRLSEKTGAHFVVAGDGIDFEAVKTLSGNLKYHDRVHFWGRYENEDAPSLARAATVIVDPVDNSPASLAKSSSRVLLAMKVGTPVVAGENGIRRMMLPYSLPWTVYTPGDNESLLNSLIYAIKTSAKEEFISHTADLWQSWTWEQIGTKFNNLLEELIK